jgi:hypothetical protein
MTAPTKADLRAAAGQEATRPGGRDILIARLRAMAQWLEDSPGVPVSEFSPVHVSQWTDSVDDARAVMAAHPGGWSKDTSPTDNYITYRHGDADPADPNRWNVLYQLHVRKEAGACERVQVGTRRVEAVEAHDEPVWEWRCAPAADAPQPGTCGDEAPFTPATFCDLAPGHGGDHRGTPPAGLRRRWRAAADDLASDGKPGIPCECGNRVAWPLRGEDVTCAKCGIVYEHDGIDIGGGARIKHHPGMPPACGDAAEGGGITCTLDAGHDGDHEGESPSGKGLHWATGGAIEYGVRVVGVQPREPVSTGEDEPPGPDDADDAMLARAVDAFGTTRPRDPREPAPAGVSLDATGGAW